jgi:hypothetical protein
MKILCWRRSVAATAVTFTAMSLCAGAGINGDSHRLFACQGSNDDGTAGVTQINGDCPYLSGRVIPKPMRSHPGNVFLLGEKVSILPPHESPQEAEALGAEERREKRERRAAAVRWRVLDDQGNEVKQGALTTGMPVKLGKLGIGWYAVEFLDVAGEVADMTTAAVLAPLAEPVPQDSPICVDAALSWLAKGGRAEQERLASLATLAGVNWIRDRIHWREMQLEPGDTLVEETTKYDVAAEVQAALGMKVLQVYHISPAWACDDPEERAHVPRDLRHTYRFCRAVGPRFKGRVQAWEPWNEGNAGNFGAHTADELCAQQKAAYLGYKAGDKDLVVCWNPMGGINTEAIAESIVANETWPYYEIFTLHSYDWPSAYEELWVPARRAACGRPLWVTECDRGMKAVEGSPWGDFTDTYGRLKAELMAHSYASSLFAGSNRHFHFVLGHYMEGDHSIQFGLLRMDGTPRRSYVALAALGRFLSGAKCLGRWEPAGLADTYVFAFRAWPDGQEQDVLVAWSEKEGDWDVRGTARQAWSLPVDVAVEAVFDHLGRPFGKEVPSLLTSGALFVVLPPGEAAKLPLRTLDVSPYREDAPCPVVLQLLTPGRTPVSHKVAWTPEYEHVLEPGQAMDVQIMVYNFGDAPVKGRVHVEGLPEGWKLTPDTWDVAVEPMGRSELKGSLSAPEAGKMAPLDNWIKVRGEFADAGRPALAFRVISTEATQTK